MSVAYSFDTKLCACGCGEELNPNLRRSHELVAAGATHAQAAAAIGVSREAVSILLRKPPKYLKGHHRLPPETYEQIKQQNASRREAAERSRRAYVLAQTKNLSTRELMRLTAHPERYTAKVMAAEDPETWAGLAWTRLAVREQRQLVEDQAKAQRKAQQAIDREIDAPTFGARDVPFLLAGERDHALMTESAECVVEREEDARRLREIVGDMDADDVLRMTEWDLLRLRARLSAEGFMPGGVQQAERERLRDPVRHAGALVQGGKSRGSREKRRQKVAATAGDRARGNSNRQEQKPEKRWARAE